MTDEELDEMLDTADTKHDGLINYSGMNHAVISWNSIALRFLWFRNLGLNPAFSTNKVWSRTIWSFLKVFVLFISKQWEYLLA